MVTRAMEREPWDRMDGEPSSGYAAFREYREAGPLRVLADVTIGHPRAVKGWSSTWQWAARAVAWDDACHVAEDRARLEAIRAMHAAHVDAGRAMAAKALEALDALNPLDVSAAAAARLLELGTRLERQTLLTSVEELQGRSVVTGDDGDPWDRIARELDGAS